MSYRSNPLRSKRASSARQHGIALITALLIVALAATAAAAIVADEQISIRRTSNTLDSEQAYLYAAGIESWAIDILGEDKKDNQFDSLDEDWASLLPPFQVDGGQISGYIEDAQGRFNLNNLVDSKGKKNNSQIVIFQNLLDNLKINEDLIPLLVDWLDSDI
ncbi:MAG TPA: general secretion pathway protein GspK, partial [Chromatiaceae bacterium]|nr:general secretion pathway protein GspK [Chromatiaceae bacterium]